jgi:hypothetical protein
MAKLVKIGQYFVIHHMGEVVRSRISLNYVLLLKHMHSRRRDFVKQRYTAIAAVWNKDVPLEEFSCIEISQATGLNFPKLQKGRG